MKELKWVKRYHNFQFINNSLVEVFLHSARDKNFALWMLASTVLTFVSGHMWKKWRFVCENLSNRLSLLMDPNLRAENN